MHIDLLLNCCGKDKESQNNKTLNIFLTMKIRGNYSKTDIF